MIKTNRPMKETNNNDITNNNNYKNNYYNTNTNNNNNILHMITNSKNHRIHKKFTNGLHKETK